MYYVVITASRYLVVRVDEESSASSIVLVHVLWAILPDWFDWRYTHVSRGYVPRDRLVQLVPL